MSASTKILSQATLIQQGAEAKVYTLDSLLPQPSIYWPNASRNFPGPTSSSGVILKHRFPKTYRHPALDCSLTATRLTFEARALARVAKVGVTVPKVVWVDEKGGVIGLEKIEGWSVREVLGGGAEGEIEEDYENSEEIEGMAKLKDKQRQDKEMQEGDSEGMRKLRSLGVTPERLMASIGVALARLHKTMLLHGDLTTSNMMIRLTPDALEPYEIVLIDFGLSSQAQFAENYAVDLYVLEKAFASTHPKSELLYAGVLEAYAMELGEKRWKPIETRLKDVRRRGRKRDMTG
ncbi:EKC/KEOPS complex subunit BUD32 [Cryptococcus depauperatus]|nr:BUD32 protein kinase [Cryptococcus depauperatus CBS 7855]